MCEVIGWAVLLLLPNANSAPLAATDAAVMASSLEGADLIHPAAAERADKHHFQKLKQMASCILT